MNRQFGLGPSTTAVMDAHGAVPARLVFANLICIRSNRLLNRNVPIRRAAICIVVLRLVASHHRHRHRHGHRRRPTSHQEKREEHSDHDRKQKHDSEQEVHATLEARRTCMTAVGHSSPVPRFAHRALYERSKRGRRWLCFPCFRRRWGTRQRGREQEQNNSSVQPQDLNHIATPDRSRSRPKKKKWLPSGRLECLYLGGARFLLRLGTSRCRTSGVRPVVHAQKTAAGQGGLMEHRRAHMPGSWNIIEGWGDF